MGRCPGCGHRLGCRVVQRVGGDQVRLRQDRLRLLGVGAHDANHHRHVALEQAARLDDAAGHLIAPRDAAEDVDQDGLHVRVVQDDPEGGRHAVRLGPAADVQEVGRLAARQLDQVHGRHGQPGAVDHAADAAVQLDEVDARLARGDLGGLLFVQVAHRLQVRVAEEGRVVEHDLGVQRQQLARLGDHQRVDLGEVGIGSHEGVVQPAQDRCERRPQIGRQPQEERGAPHVVVLQAQQRIDRQAQDRLRVGDCRLLDLDPALGAGDDRHRLGPTVQDQPQVELLGDVGRRRDQHGLHPNALDVQADDLARPLLRLVRAGGQLDAAGLAPAADQHLRLDHHRPADALRGGARLLRAGRHLAGQQRHAVAGKDLL